MWIIADAVASADWIPSIANLGVSGYMLWWLTTKLIPEIRRMSDAMNASSRVQLMQLLVHPRFPEEAKEPAKRELDDLPKP
jgi:hypothetical protein